MMRKRDREKGEKERERERETPGKDILAERDQKVGEKKHI